MSFRFDNLYNDAIDVRDVIERYEELENDLLACFNEQQEIEGDNTTTDDSENALFNEWLKVTTHQGVEEFKNLKTLLDDLEGDGGDEKWRGSWYPQCLISRSYFKEYMDETVFSCYDIPELPSFMRIELDYVALEMDYSSVYIDGVEYLYR